MFSLKTIQSYLEYQPSDKIGLFLPLSFTYGLYQIFLAIDKGATLYIPHSNSLFLNLLKELNDNGITILPVTPSLLKGMFRVFTNRFCPVPSLRMLTSAGERLPNTYVEKLNSYFPSVKFYNMYGLTECARVSILLPEEMNSKSSSVGKPLKGTRVSIIGENGEILKPNEIGELVVQGKHVTLGYWNLEQETQKTFKKFHWDEGGLLYTGDLCKLDEDGYIYFISRKNDIFSHRGFRISALEIENATYEINGVYDTGVIKSEKKINCIYSLVKYRA